MRPVESPLKKRLLSARILVLLVAVLALIYTLGPRAFAKGWHLIYGDHLQYSGFTIPVPNGWFARQRTDRPIMSRGTPSLSAKIFRFDSITFGPLPAEGQSSAQEYEQWKARASDETFLRAHRVENVRIMEVAKHSALCYERSVPALSSDFSSGCMVEGEMMIFILWRARPSCRLLPNIGIYPLTDSARRTIRPPLVPGKPTSFLFNTLPPPNAPPPR